MLQTACARHPQRPRIAAIVLDSGIFIIASAGQQSRSAQTLSFACTFATLKVHRVVLAAAYDSSCWVLRAIHLWVLSDQTRRQGKEVCLLYN